MNAPTQERDSQTTFPLGDRRFSREEMAVLAVAAAMDKKAFRPVLLDLRSQGAFTEYFAIVSATNARQVTAVAEGVRMFFKQSFGLSPLSVDGLESQTWVLLDYGFLFVHVFQDPTRELYALEQLWSKGRLVAFTEESAGALYGDVRALVADQAEADDAEDENAFDQGDDLDDGDRDESNETSLPSGARGRGLQGAVDAD